MQDPPAPDALLGFIADFLREELLPQLSGRAAFDVRVCANAVDLVRRQITLAPDAEAAELASLEQLLGHGGDLEGLNAELCARIRDRDISLDTPGFLEHLRATTLAKLAVDQPGYAAYRRARETWGAN